MRTMKLIYIILLVLNNVFAGVFIGIVFLGGVAMDDEAPHPLNEQQALIRLIGYGIAVSLFFSLISIVIGLIFKKKLHIGRRHLTRLFLFQFMILIVGFAVTCLYIYY